MFKNKLSVFNLIKAIVIFLLTVIAMAFIFAVVMYYLGGGYEFSPLFATVCLAVGCFTASFYLGLVAAERGIFIGLSVGGAAFVITLIITLIFNKGAVTVHLLLRFIILTLAALVGAIVAVNKASNKRLI